MKETIILSVLGLKEEITLDFEEPVFREDFTRFFDNALKKNVFEFKEQLLRNFPELTEKETLNHIHDKIKNSQPNNYISLMVDNYHHSDEYRLTLIGIIKQIFGDTLSCELEEIYMDIIHHEYTPMSHVFSLLNIENFQGISTNLEVGSGALKKYKKKRFKMEVSVK